VDEESYYGSLEKLLNGIGKPLKPQVRCVIQLKNRGGGQPDGGLFTKEQWDHGDTQAALLGQVPSRGVIEVKSPGDDTWVTIESKQVSKYWQKYQLVLVTNYRDFVLIGKDRHGNPVKLESYHLATSEDDFWMKVAHPKKFAQEYGDTFTEYLKRAMLQAVPISSPRDLAWFLASYARTAITRIEGKDIPAMKSVREALEAALGLKFEGDKGEHFFRSTLVQTIFYGLFSAWVLWAKKRTPTSSEYFDWRTAAWHLQVPVMQALFEKIVTPSHLGPLELEDTLSWASSTLNRVDRTSFFSAFEEGKVVQYFYEPFLEAFDPELRKQLGVWYTPPEIVQYMVARVDTVLREELNLADGLADPSVFVLDPCCGTGSYLVEVLRRIHQTFKAKRNDALLASDLKQAALKRVFGFEILPAPFVVSHMQLGLLLQSLGAPLSEKDRERAGVYLTNALTGWEPLDPEKEKAFQAMLTGFPQLLEEQTDARKVKQRVPILVILGNPPYNAFAGTAPTKEERDSVASYKEGLIKKWGIKKFNLDDLYVRFFRMAERRIAEQTGRGVVCFISNYSWIEEPSFVVLRQHFLQSFDIFWVENLHGNRKISEYAPDGRTSETIFAIPGFSVGIQQGVATSLWVKKPEKLAERRVYFRDDIDAARAVERRKQLLESLGEKDFDAQYQLATPSESNRYSFRPSKVSADYLAWPRLTELAVFYSNGLMEKRKGALIDINRSALEKRMSLYYDRNTDWQTLKNLQFGFTEDAARYNAHKTREKVLKNEIFSQERICRYLIRPFDIQWCYYSPIRPLWNEPRPSLWQHYWKENSYFISRVATTKPSGGTPFYHTPLLSDDHLLTPDASCFPIRIRAQFSKNNKPKEQAHLIQPPDDEGKIIANLSQLARDYLASLGIDNPDTDAHTASLIWMHALAIGYSPVYLNENADGIRKDWPRIPLPDKKELLGASAELGERIATLLDTEKPVAGVTASPVRPELQVIAVITREGGGQLQASELGVTAGWGHAGQNGVVMPGKGTAVQRDYTADERQAITSGAELLGISPDDVFKLLGESTFDIYLNDIAYWKNVPVKVWEYTIGGYQVIKKWLSYREAELLGRPLTPDEAREVMDIVRRLAVIILLQPALDENYQKCKGNVYKEVAPNG